MEPALAASPNAPRSHAFAAILRIVPFSGVANFEVAEVQKPPLPKTPELTRNI